MNYAHVYNDPRVVSVWRDFNKLPGGKHVEPKDPTLNILYAYKKKYYVVAYTFRDWWPVPDLCGDSYYGVGVTIHDALMNDFDSGPEKEVPL